MGEDQKLWDAYNLLTTGPDLERLRKILVRAEFFRRVLEIPGDIVECGVFKGSGLLLWTKLLAIFAPGSNKKVIGFDLFQGFADHAEEGEQSAVRELLDEANYPEDFSPAHIEAYLRAAGQEPRCRLVPGDIQHTGAAYCASHPGFRISLLHLDFDLAAPTEAALEVFWP
ncbi:MAG: TylF/MycF/NovP-related O-methyltransferase, partial [Myxococcota bacterium]